MATGDITISISVAGGVTKSVVLDSATRVLALKRATSLDATVDTDAEWQVLHVNKYAGSIVNQANAQSQIDASWTAKTYTKAT